MLLDAAVADPVGELQLGVSAQELIEVHPPPLFIAGFAAVTAGGNHPRAGFRGAERLHQPDRAFAQLQKGHHLPGEGLHHLDLHRRELAGLAVDHAQGSDPLPSNVAEGKPGIEADFRVAAHERVVVKPFIPERIAHDQWLRCVDRMGAERPVPRRFGGVDAHLGFEPLPVHIHKAEQRNRGLADQ